MKPPLIGFLTLVISTLAGSSENCPHCVDDLLSALNRIEKSFGDMEKLRAVGIMMNQADNFLNGITPWSELFAKGLEEGIEGKELEKLLKLLFGLANKMKEIERKEKQILQQPHWYYSFRYQQIVNVLTAFYKQVDSLAKKQLKVHKTLINHLVEECNGVNSPKRLMEHFSTISSEAPRPAVFLEISDELMNLVNFYRYKNDTIDKKELQDKTTMLYLQLERHGKEEAVERLRFFRVDNPKQDAFDSRSDLLNTLIKYFFLKDKVSWENFETGSLFKAELMLGGYKGSYAIEAASVMSEHLYLTMAYASLCSNISNYDRPERATAYIKDFLDGANEPVYFVSNWYNQLLTNSWPSIDKRLLRDFILKEARGFDIPRETVVYDIILNKLMKELKGIGHPDFNHEYIIVPGYSYDKQSKSEYLAGEGSHINVEIVRIADVDLFVFRTNWTVNGLIKKQDQLISLVNKMKPVILQAMENEFYNAAYPVDVITNLTKYGIDFRDMIGRQQFEFVLVVRNYQFLSGCSNEIAAGTAIDMRGRVPFPFIHYHYDAAWSTDDCEDWLFIFGHCYRD